MKLKLIVFGLACVLLLPGVLLAHDTEAPHSEFYRAKILEITEEGMTKTTGQESPFQIVKAKILHGPGEGSVVIIPHGTQFTLNPSQKVKAGETVVVSQNTDIEGSPYFIIETDRIAPLIVIGLIFFALAVLFAGRKGFSSILGMVVSVLILAMFVVPNIMAGKNPLIISLVATFFIAFLSLYLAHGFNKRTTIALISTLTTLCLSALLATLFVALAKLSGLGSEETTYLQWGVFENLNFKGLLLGGIIIGALGVLDDIATAQVAVVHELKQANSSLSRRELYRRASAVGKEHIASLVNTLVLAYAGASLPSLILFAADSDIPFWVALNSEFIAEEIIRTLVGSTVLVCAVPISTFFAAWFLSKPKPHRSLPSRLIS